MRGTVLSAIAGVLLAGPALADARMANIVKSNSLPVVPAITDPAFQAEILRAHNVERSVVGVKPLVWSASLAADAKAWADQLALRGGMVHSSQRTHGENLWVNRAGARPIGAMVGGWSIEKTYYRTGGRHPNTSITGDWHVVGHYQQMVWHDTSHVGCAISRGHGRDFLVCRYAPMGNTRGEMAFDPAGIKAAAPARTGNPAPSKARR